MSGRWLTLAEYALLLGALAAVCAEGLSLLAERPA